MDTKTQNCK